MSLGGSDQPGTFRDVFGPNYGLSCKISAENSGRISNSLSGWIPDNEIGQISITSLSSIFQITSHQSYVFVKIELICLKHCKRDRQTYTHF